MEIFPLAAQFVRGDTFQVEWYSRLCDSTVPQWEFTGTGTCTYNPTANLQVEGRLRRWRRVQSSSP